ncbi:MAG: hypothetical protein SGJ26_09640 [Nitrospirota bacterium]|nr:hypothetical protein [Nitrospirota bacterium]
MVNSRQGWGIVCVTLGLGLLVIGDADSLAPWNPDSQTATSKEQETEHKTPKMGVLVGRATRGPSSSVESPAGQFGPSPASNIRIVISIEAAEAITTGLTDTRGEYRIDLTSGSYLVEIAPLAGIEYTKDLPAVVAISAGRETRLDFHIDTGIR